MAKIDKDMFTTHFENLMKITAFNMNKITDELIEDTIFNYRKYFVEFFEYMSQNCSTDQTKYTCSAFLREKIDEFGENFKNEYLFKFNLSKKKCFKKWSDDKKIEKAIELKKKFCGNLLEIINGLYIIDFQIITGYEFDSWCNNTNDDFKGVDGILKRISNPNIKIPINTKHSIYNSIDKFLPFIKLGNWVKDYTRKLVSVEDKLAMLDLPHDGIIFTDNSTKDFVKNSFQSILVWDEINLLKNLGKQGNNIGNVTIWKDWYNIIK